MRDIENSTPENPYLDDCHYAQGIFLHDGVYYVVAGERVLLRHKSLTTTERYLRELEDYTGSLLTTYDVRIE